MSTSSAFGPAAIDLGALAHILSLIAAPPGHRSERRSDDLQGAFDEWFDGGAIKHVTGWSEYHFADGTVAVVPVVPKLQVDIRFSSGAHVRISELSKVPPFFPVHAV